jgi:hypothetical protein
VQISSLGRQDTKRAKVEAAFGSRPRGQNKGTMNLPLHAKPGPACIELQFGTAEEGTDMDVELPPAEARAIVRALLDHAATAERDGPQ